VQRRPAGAHASGVGHLEALAVSQAEIDRGTQQEEQDRGDEREFHHRLGALPPAPASTKARPREGDQARAWGPPFVDGDGVLFFAANAGKRSLAVDLEEDLDVVLRLVDEADVFVQSLRPGLAERRGLGADALRARNSRLVYCTIGAYGATGPLADRPGYDPLMQAASGLMTVTGEPGGPPVRSGVSLIDFATGQWAAIGILAALLEPGADGRGPNDRHVALRDVARPARVAAHDVRRHRRGARAARVGLPIDRTV